MTPLRIALLDLYNREPNQGMRALREIVQRYALQAGIPVTLDVFEIRHTGEAPDLSYDLYLSSGGPGSPFDGVGTSWEARYFALVDALWNHNARHAAEQKHVLFICHSFQMMCRFFEIAQVTERRSPSFGILPVHKTKEGRKEPLLEGLADPFYAADFRKWQVVRPDRVRLASLGGQILCLEKIRPHVPLERAVMGIRLSEAFVGFQFHPEADPPGMSVHFRAPERRDEIIRRHGLEKYEGMIHRLEHPSFVLRTYRTIIPRFLARAAAAARPAPTDAAHP